MVMKKKVKIGIIIAAIVVVLILAIVNKTILGSFLGLKKETSADDIPTVELGYHNLAQAFSGSSMVQDLPKDSKIVLRFYNFNSGQREWEKSYIMTKGNVEEGYTDDADLVVIMHSRYLQGLTNKNFCSAVQIAQKNGDFGTESELSKATLLWKFKSMMKYRECFGY